MMAFVPLAVLFAVVSTISIVVDRRLQKGKHAMAVASAAEPAKAAMTDSAAWRGRLKGWRDKITRRQSAELPQQFRAWIANATAENTAVKEWLQALSNDGLEAFTKDLAVFCAGMGFELQWLVAQHLDKNPELAQALGEVVWHYCRACQQVAGAQEDLQLYKQLQAFERNPTSKQHQAFGQKLFAKVVEGGLTSVTMSQYITASPKEQPQLVLQAIHEAAAEHNEAFKRVLHETGQAPETGAQPAATSASQSGSQEPAAASSSA